MHRRFTTALETYDGFGTKTLRWTSWSEMGRRFREVEILDERFDWQTTWYLRGNREALTKEEFEERKPTLDSSPTYCHQCGSSVLLITDWSFSELRVNFTDGNAEIVRIEDSEPDWAGQAKTVCTVCRHEGILADFQSDSLKAA